MNAEVFELDDTCITSSLIKHYIDGATNTNLPILALNAEVFKLDDTSPTSSMIKNDNDGSKLDDDIETSLKLNDPVAKSSKVDKYKETVLPHDTIPTYRQTIIWQHPTARLRGKIHQLLMESKTILTTLSLTLLPARRMSTSSLHMKSSRA